MDSLNRIKNLEQEGNFVPLQHPRVPVNYQVQALMIKLSVLIYPLSGNSIRLHSFSLSSNFTALAGLVDGKLNRLKSSLFTFLTTNLL